MIAQIASQGNEIDTFNPTTRDDLQLSRKLRQHAEALGMCHPRVLLLKKAKETLFTHNVSIEAVQAMGASCQVASSIVDGSFIVFVDSVSVADWE